MKIKKVLTIKKEKWIVRENGNSTIVEMGKIIKVLPFKLEETLDFIKKLGIVE